MQKHRQIEIDENDPFKNDLLDRKKEISNLTSIVLNFNDPLVLALNAPWGAGKTTFVKLWQAHLKLEGKHSICFNAWETDFADDPLIVLVSEFDKWLKSTNNDPIITKWSKGIKHAFPGVVKRTAVVGTKLATLGAFDISAEYESILADFAEKIAGDLLENFNKQKKSLENFKGLVAEALDALPDGQKNLVIFIDELDRCRPTYAIELLERIKHLFKIERLVFVLSTDKTELAHSIRAVYGNDFNGTKYLDRFIELDYSLKKADPEKYVQTLLESLKIETIFNSRHYKHEFAYLINCILILAKALELKPREINALLVRVRLTILSIPKDEQHEVPLLVALLVLRGNNKELYEKYVSNPSVADQVVTYLLGSSFPPNSANHDHDQRICEMIGFLIAPNKSNAGEFARLIDPYIRKAKDNNDAECEMIIQLANEPRNTHGRHYIKHFNHKLTVERIEFVHQINIQG